MFLNSPLHLSFPHQRLRLSAIAAALCAGISCCAQGNPAPKPAVNPEPDVLVLSNGDTLHGKFVNEIAGKVTFHSDALGDISLGWDKIKELRTSQKFAVLTDQVKVRSKKSARQIPVGTFEVANQAVTVHPDNATAEPPIPVKTAQYISIPPKWISS